MAGTEDKPLVWLHREIKTPPLSKEARVEAGVLLRRLQGGEVLALPCSRPMPSIGTRCHELRIVDREHAWRIIYRVDTDAIVVVDLFSKKTPGTPTAAIDRCKTRLRRYDELAR
jgi:phage-related protein